MCGAPKCLKSNAHIPLIFGLLKIGGCIPVQFHFSFLNCHVHSPCISSSALKRTLNSCGFAMQKSTAATLMSGMLSQMMVWISGMLVKFWLQDGLMTLLNSKMLHVCALMGA